MHCLIGPQALLPPLGARVFGSLSGGTGNIMREPPTSEKWVGPFQLRELMDYCINENFAKPPEAGSAYLITKDKWKTKPTAESIPLYIGGNTGKSVRFRTRVGDLVADACGFFSPGGTGHHSGGQSIYDWCKRTRTRPLDLYIAWIEGTDCHRCLEVRLYEELKPQLNRNRPSQCKVH
jgi:hypothetical protein